jgi:hypothetical protein
VAFSCLGCRVKKKRRQKEEHLMTCCGKRAGGTFFFFLYPLGWSGVNYVISLYYLASQCNLRL